MKKLQNFHFLRSAYERPTQRRTCGARAFGKACQMGPDKDGGCRGQFECIPAKKKDRWFCTRSAESGGSCLHGPKPDGTCCNRLPPCQPESSLRSSRGSVTRWVVVFLLALTGFAYLSGDGPDLVADPGPLSNKHSFKGQSCNNCHLTEGDLWQRALASPGIGHANDKCQECHKIEANPSSPHNLAPQQLAALVEVRASKAGVDPVEVAEQLRCGSCHNEHRGKNADLTAMLPGRCESCHVTRHPDFATQHPEFEQFPYQRRTRLNFDHSAHFAKHFKKKKLAELAPRECSNCHELDSDKAYMVSASFGNACADCHGKGTTGEQLSDPGIRLLALPFVDVESLQEREINIGSWPDGPEDPYLPPALVRMLANDPGIGEFVQLFADPDEAPALDDLSEADDETLQNVGATLRRLKLLLADARERGRIAFAEALGDQALAESLFKGLDDERIGQIVDRWFPGLEDELDGLRAGNAETDVGEAGEAEEAEDLRPGGWREEYFVVSYRPAGHGDPVMQAWLDLAGRGMADATPADRQLYAQFADPKVSGQCAKCHSGDRGTGGAIAFNWSPTPEEGRRDGLTRFRHEPHFQQPGIEGCETCHTLDGEAAYAAGFEDNDPLTFASNFAPLEKSLCAECHTQDQAGQDCATCHYYHFVETSPARTASAVINRPDRDTE